MASALAGLMGLPEQTKVVAGAVGILAGVGLIATMTFAGIESAVAQILLGVVGVIAAVVGTLLLGTSEDRDQIV